MIVGVLLSLITGPMFMGVRQYPWAAVPFVALAVIVLHPLMNRDVPSLIGTDMLKSPRTYVGIALVIAAELVSAPVMRAFKDRFVAGH